MTAPLLELDRLSTHYISSRGTRVVRAVDEVSLRVEAGDSVFIPGGMPHNELRTSDDVEILEVSVPGELGTVPCDPPAARR